MRRKSPRVGDAVILRHVIRAWHKSHDNERDVFLRGVFIVIEHDEVNNVLLLLSYNGITFDDYAELFQRL